MDYNQDQLDRGAKAHTHRVVNGAFLRYLGSILPEGLTLDIGSDCGHIPAGLIKMDYKSRIIGIDQNIMTRYATLKAPGYQLINTTAESLPFKDNVFNSAYCLHTLEHLYNDQVEKLFNELKRVIKTGGLAYMVVPEAQHYDAGTHNQYFSIQSLRELLSEHFDKVKFVKELLYWCWSPGHEIEFMVVN